jgi:hypothetical protein
MRPQQIDSSEHPPAAGTMPAQVPLAFPQLVKVTLTLRGRGSTQHVNFYTSSRIPV